MSTTTLAPAASPPPTRTRLRTLRLPVLAYVAILLAIPVALLISARATGWWVTTGHTVPAPAPGGGVRVDGAVGPQPTLGTAAGAMSPHDVTGSMTLAQLIDAFPVLTAAEVCERFGAPADTPLSTPLKTLAKNGNGFDVTDLRGWLETRRTPP